MRSILTLVVSVTFCVLSYTIHQESIVFVSHRIYEKKSLKNVLSSCQFTVWLQTFDVSICLLQ